MTDFQLWSSVTLKNTLLDNQIGDKLQYICTVWKQSHAGNVTVIVHISSIWGNDKVG